MTVATPRGYEPDSEIVRKAEEDGRETGFKLLVTTDPSEAIQDADAVYTDTWTSMGQEAEKEGMDISDWIGYGDSQQWGSNGW